MEDSEISSGSLDGAYKPLPHFYLAFMVIWFFSALFWTFNTYKNRHFQSSTLQWALATVPAIKALQLLLSFLFWYSCLYSNICSLWLSFGVYITGILFQTATFISFSLISHGYRILCCRLSLSERRIVCGLGCVLYLTLVGHRASIPYFSVILFLDYLVIFYVIFHRVSQNLQALREQLNFIECEDVQAMHDAVHMKFVMLKKFQVAMHCVAVLELAIFINTDHSLENYWIRLLVREWAQYFLLTYIGWIFRPQEMASHFSLMPILKSTIETIAPPIYSISLNEQKPQEMDAETFKEFASHEWHIGVPTLSSHKGRSLEDSVIVMIQHPRAYNLPSLSNKGSPVVAPTFIPASFSEYRSNPIQEQCSILLE
ncbi:hypothetical protein F511_06000 [Dorcoceras hygrometricum]|uniref:Uncharacterized protein n=1 Tax=Dorcoceras hygrometricum TaxID=472368 RepID=A0A2Z7AW39_9LAMI|nr:hypothetical protein F511_06000 [Dorcoceras hygrometricum]